MVSRKSHTRVSQDRDASNCLSQAVSRFWLEQAVIANAAAGDANERYGFGARNQSSVSHSSVG